MNYILFSFLELILPQCPSDSSIWLHLVVECSSLCCVKTLLCVCAEIYLFIRPLINICIVSSTELIRLMLFWIVLYMSFGAHMCTYLWNCWVIRYTDVQLWWILTNSFPKRLCQVTAVVAVEEVLHTLHPHKQLLVFSFLNYLFVCTGS